MDIARKMRRDWDRRCQEHARFWIATDDYQNEESFAASGAATARDLLAALPDETQDLWNRWSVLEIGCGVGRVLRPLSATFGRVCGVDVSARMIEKSRDWLEGLSAIDARVGSGLDLHGWNDAEFDLVYSYVASQHMPRSVFASYLKESNRVLRPGGLLLLQCWIGPHNDLPLSDTLTVRRYPVSELDGMLDAAGFERNPDRRLPTETSAPANQWVLAHRTRSAAPQPDTEWRRRPCPDDPVSTDVGLRLYLGHEHAEAGRDDEAIQVLSELMAHDPSQLGGWLLLVSLLLRQGRGRTAVAQMRRLLLHHPQCEPIRRSLRRLEGRASRRSPVSPHVV